MLRVDASRSKDDMASRRLLICVLAVVSCAQLVYDTKTWQPLDTLSGYGILSPVDTVGDSRVVRRLMSPSQFCCKVTGSLSVALTGHFSPGMSPLPSTRLVNLRTI